MQPSDFFYEPPLTPEEEYLLSLDYDFIDYDDLLNTYVELSYDDEYLSKLLLTEPLLNLNL